MHKCKRINNRLDANYSLVTSNKQITELVSFSHAQANRASCTWCSDLEIFQHTGWVDSPLELCISFNKQRSQCDWMFWRIGSSKDYVALNWHQLCFRKVCGLMIGMTEHTNKLHDSCFQLNFPCKSFKSSWVSIFKGKYQQKKHWMNELNHKLSFVLKFFN